MNVFKKNSVYMAVLAGLGAIGAAGTASAVHVNPDGLGQVLIYPYYTVRSAATPIASGQYNTYVSVTNTTASSKAVKVRFIEGKHSREVLDFNLFLSPYDTWAGVVLPVNATAANGAKVVTYDKSCTWGNVAAAGSAGVPFSNLAYINGTAGNNADWESGSLDRTNEGYIEIMEMGRIDTGVALGAALNTAITHVSGVAPCTSSVLNAADVAGLTGYLVAGNGGLMGGATLINTATGVDYAYDAIAIDNWDATAAGVGSAASSLNPSIVGGSVLVSNVFNGGAAATATWLTNQNAVSAAMTRNTVMNEYVMDSGTASATDWVVTFPTKRFYVNTEASSSAHTAAPFPSGSAANRLFNQNFGTGGSCDLFNYSLRDREEQLDAPPGSLFSPAAGTSPQSLCWETNVVTFARGSFTAGTATPILGSTNSVGVTVPASFSNGWMSMTWAASVTVNSPSITPAAGLVHYGLPVVGFMVQDFINSTIVTGTGAAAGAAHGGQFVHKHTRDIR